MTESLVIMGVAGCGKSSLGAAVAQATGLRLVEGDDYHSAENRSKMSHGVALTDSDRDGWLTTLSEQLRAHPSAFVQQFLQGDAEGPVEFQYSQHPYLSLAGEHRT